MEIDNAVTGVTKASFEPALDYLVVKVPRWDLKKFKRVTKQLGSGMKSVGEVMAIGRTFEEGLQKGLRMLDIGVDGLTAPVGIDGAGIEEEIGSPTDERVFAVYSGFKKGMTVEEIQKLSHIDPWFLAKLKNIVDVENALEKNTIKKIDEKDLRKAKRLGFSDRQIGRACGCDEGEVRDARKQKNIKPAIKQIDTLAAEYPARTNYLYSTYSGTENDVSSIGRGSVMVLGSGAYRIGSSVEFDWCCVNTVQSLRKMGFKTIMVNCNPETVSTDFDECDRLYFEELTFETVLDIYEREQPVGVVVSVGGQTANNLALKLAEVGAHILGTPATMIDRAEDRHKFSKMLDELSVNQPAWSELSTTAEALKFAEEVGYPVLVRPSYVLSGAAMAVATSDEELKTFLEKASDVSPDHPVVITKFVLGAKEVELDGVANKGELVAYVISEHVENAGVHSGDATMVVPPQRMYLETTRQVKKIAACVARALEINGPFNIQFLAKDNDVSVIECNLRASRSFPFVSKVCGTNLIDIATKVMVDWPVPEVNLKPFNLEYVGVKAPQFSFTRLQGADPTLSVEMSSTGEVGCLGDDFEEAFLKSMISVGLKLPIKSVLLSTGPTESKVDFLPAAKALQKMGIKILATDGTAKFLKEKGVEAESVAWPLDGGSDTADARIRAGEADLVVNIPKNYQKDELTNGYHIRRVAADFGVSLVTNIQLAKRIVESIERKKLSDLKCKDWASYLVKK